MFLQMPYNIRELDVSCTDEMYTSKKELYSNKEALWTLFVAKNIVLIINCSGLLRIIGKNQFIVVWLVYHFSIKSKNKEVKKIISTVGRVFFFLSFEMYPRYIYKNIYIFNWYAENYILFKLRVI